MKSFFVRIVIVSLSVIFSAKITEAASLATEPADSVTIAVEVADGHTDLPLRTARVSVIDSAGVVLVDSMGWQIREANSREAFDHVVYSARVPGRSFYIIEASAPGFETDRQTVATRMSQSWYHAPEMTLVPASSVKELAGVEVRASKVKMVMRGDTIEYDATAFKLPNGSMLDDLIRALPGASLDDNGRITVNGQFVSELLLNGRKFFSGDPQVALRNLPHYTVKNLQVYRKTPDHLAGFENGRDRSRDPLVMDVNLKREYLGSWIANVEAGGGSSLGHGWDTRWLGRLFAMRYNKISYIALFATANNLNDAEKAGSKGEWRKPSVTVGETTTKRAGIEYNSDWRDQPKSGSGYNVKFDIMRQTTLDASTVASEQYMAGGNTWARRRTETDRGLWRYAGAGEISRNFPFGRLWFKADGRYERGTSAQASSSAEGPSPDGFAAPGSAEWLRSVLYHREMLTGEKNHTAKVNFTSMNSFRLPSKKLGLNLNLDAELTDSRLRAASTDRVAYTATPADDIDLVRRDRAPSRGHWLRFAPYLSFHGIKFPGRFWLSGGVGYDADMRFDSGSRTLEQLDSADAATTVPSADTQGWIIDSANSWHTMRRVWKHRLSPTFLLANGRVNIELSAAAAYNHRNIRDRRDSRRRDLTRSDWTFAPSLRLRVGRNMWSDGYGFSVGMSEELPELMRLLDVRDTSDPLVVRLGNPDLDKSRVYRASLFFTKNLTAHARMIDLSLDYEKTDRATAMARSYDRATGVTTWQPMNVDGNWRASASLNYSRSMARADRLNVSNELNPVIVHSVDYSSDSETPQRVAADRWTIADRLTLRYRINTVSVGGKVDFAWNRLRSRDGIFAPFHYTDINYGVTLGMPLPGGIDLSTDLMLYTRRGYDDPSMNTSDWVWNLQMMKTFGPSKQWTVKAIGFDLLRQLPTIRRVVNAQGSTETRYNSQPAYAIVTLAYRLDIKPRRL